MNLARDENGFCKTCGVGQFQYHHADCLFEPKAPHPVLDAPSPRSVLDEAAGIVHGARQQAYGHPRDNHACTAALWNAYLERRGAYGPNDFGGLTARDVCWLNILQKASRDAHSPSRDNLVDVAGFAANAEMVDDGA